MLSMEYIWVKTRTVECEYCGELFTESLILYPHFDDWVVNNIRLTTDFRKKHKDHTLKVVEELVTSKRGRKH